MADTKYTYAVARIRAKETTLLTDAVIEQILACRDEEAALRFLKEKGWGDGSREETAEEMLAFEQKKAWKEVRELAGGEKFLKVLTIPKEFHNLKAAVKQVCSSVEYQRIFYEEEGLDTKKLWGVIEKHRFEELPDSMREAAREATEALLQTRDGQLCDIIVDRAAMEAMRKEAKTSGSPLVLSYVETMIAAADIRIAVRSAKTKKSAEFMRRAMADCEPVRVPALIHAALNGVEAIQEYLRTAGFRDMADAIGISFSAFEKCCDDRIIQTIQPERYHAFSEGPVVAYLLARENEIKTVRIILSGKANGLSEESIRERVRKMYV